MSRIAYVNGRYLPWRDARVHVEDRGYQFADGVYEVCEVKRGRMVDERRHVARLERSLAELRIDMPMSAAALSIVMRETIARNKVGGGIVYLQITRGVARRDHAFPPAGTAPGIVVTARNLDQAQIAANAAAGITVVTVPDNRWARVDIKSVGLLPNVLARQAAKEQGAHEAWYVDKEGHVTEGASCNAWIITADRKAVTRAADQAILRGITRDVLIGALQTHRIKFEERAFTVAEALAAREAFITSASQTVMPVVRVDGKPVGDGKPGPVSTALRQAFYKHAEVD